MQEATRLEDGLCLLCDQFAFPASSSSGAPPLSARVVGRKDSTCPGCRSNIESTSPKHTRERGQCHFPDVQPVEWPCPGCQKGASRANAEHRRDETCRWSIAPNRAGSARKGKHPRDPAQPASASSVSGLPGQVRGEELGHDLERGLDEDVLGEDADVQVEPSLAPPRRKGVRFEQYPEPGGEWDESDRVVAARAAPSPASSSMNPAAEGALRVGRGPDVAQRERHAIRRVDAAVGPENAADWTHFDIKRVLRTLRLASPAQCQLTLRKLHIRWWHAKAAAMHRLLSAAGVPKEILELIPSIVQTCKACRS